MSWRNLAIFLALLCTYQAWRGCRRVAPQPTEQVTDCTELKRDEKSSSWSSNHAAQTAQADEPAPAPTETPGLKLGGFKIPAWAMWLAPQPGENLLDYRDRIVPIAQAAVAPHRARVVRGRDDFAKQVGLDAQQRAQLDASVAEAATAIQDKVMGSIMSGDIMPARFKPMKGVSLAHDVLGIVDQANQKFVSSLREDQKSKLAQHPFDFADYLLFSARWEDALGVTN